jgi:hypothetical protein
MTPLQIQDIYDQLLDVQVSVDTKKQLLRDVYKHLDTSSPLRGLLAKWYTMPEIPFLEIVKHLQIHLIPTSQSSTIAKKRRQTPRRRYTRKKA